MAQGENKSLRKIITHGDHVNKSSEPRVGGHAISSATTGRLGSGIRSTRRPKTTKSMVRSTASAKSRRSPTPSGTSTAPATGTKKQQVSPIARGANTFRLIVFAAVFYFFIRNFGDIIWRSDRVQNLIQIVIETFG